MAELSFEDVEKWLNGMSEAGALKPATIRSILQVLKMIIAFGVKRGYASRNAATEAAGEHHGWVEEPIRTFTKEHVTTLLRLVEIRPRWREQRTTEMLRAFVHIAAFCGLRWGEISGLTLPAINFNARLVHVRHSLSDPDHLKAPKSRAGIRDVPMPGHVCAFLQSWISQHYTPNDRQLIFRLKDGGPWTAANFHKAWRDLLGRAGLSRCPKEGWHHFHALRHFAASLMIEKGLPITDVAAILGHSKFDTTLQTYAHAIVPGHRRLETADLMAIEMLGAPLLEATALDGARA